MTAADGDVLAGQQGQGVAAYDIDIRLDVDVVETEHANARGATTLGNHTGHN
jgi:hypothetical protein